jgi:hypothetical protein
MLIFMRLMKPFRYVLRVSLTGYLSFGNNIYFYFSIQAVALANQKLLGIPSVSDTYIKLPFILKHLFQKIHPGSFVICYAAATFSSI